MLAHCVSYMVTVTVATLTYVFPSVCFIFKGLSLYNPICLIFRCLCRCIIVACPILALDEVLIQPYGTSTTPVLPVGMVVSGRELSKIYDSLLFVSFQMPM